MSDFYEHFFSYISRQRRRGHVLKSALSAYTTENNTLVDGGDIEIDCLRQDFSLNIAYENLKIGQWTALAVIFAMVVELAIFMNISLRTFQGKGDEVMYSSATRV